MNITENDILTKMLDTNLFINNVYLHKYVHLVYDNIHNIKQSKFENHHIIPRNCFKVMNISDKSIIDSDDNLVYISINNHILAHYLLQKCASNVAVLQNNIIALFFMINEKYNGDAKYEIFESIEEYNEMKEQWRKCIGDYTRGKKRPKISEYLLKNHFDCSDGNNSRAKEVYVFDLDTLELVAVYEAQNVASRELKIPELRNKLNKSKYKLVIFNNFIITKNNTIDMNNLQFELQRLNELKRRERKTRVLTCSYCGKSFERKLNDDDYAKKMKHGAVCRTCNSDGTQFRGKPFSEEHKRKISIARTKRDK